VVVPQGVGRNRAACRRVLAAGLILRAQSQWRVRRHSDTRHATFARIYLETADFILKTENAEIR